MWNFWEASDGKGESDGIGGAIKRKADALVSQGNDITDANTLYQALRSACTTIKLFFVEADEVESSTLPAITLPSVSGTMKLHQLKTSGTPGTITYQDVSCFCANLDCSCFSPKIFTFPVVSSTESESSRPNVLAVADNLLTPAAGNVLAVADNPVTVIVSDNVVAVADEECDQSQADNHKS